MTSAGAPTFFRHQTRAAQYQQRFSYPPGFADTIKLMTRECLREQPKDIYAWAAQFFSILALDAPQPRRPSETAGGPPQVLPDAIDEETFGGLCDLHAQLADVLSLSRNSSGRVSVDVVRRLIQDSFKLPHPHTVYLLSLMTDAMTVNTRSVDAAAFAATAVPALYVFCTSTTPVEFPLVEHEGTDNVHGHDAETVRSLLLHAFVHYDRGQSGRVKASDYATVLRSAPIDLTERDVCALIVEAACDADGAVDYRSEITSRVYPTLKLTEAFEAFDGAAAASGAWPVPFGARMPPLKEMV